MALQQGGIIVCSCENEMEDLIEVLESMVLMDVWDQIWKQFMAAWRADVFRASSAMAADLVKFIDGKTSGKTGKQAILVSLPGWIREWMEETLKK